MKNLIIILFLFSLNTTLAQIQTGSIGMGGGLNMNGESMKAVDDAIDRYNSNDSNFGVNAGYEKFKNETISCGFFINYSYSGYSYEYEYELNIEKGGRRTHMVSVGPSVTKYIPIRDKLYFTIRSGISVGIGQEKSINTDSKFAVWSAGIGANPGLTFFLNNNLALSAGIGRFYYMYSSEKAKEENTTWERPNETNHKYGLSFNLNTFTFGLKYYLRTAKSE